MIRHIVAFDQKQGIAKNGVQPWSIPDDEHYFTEKTKTYGGDILVGSRTFNMFDRPLVDRRNFVVTHRTEPISGAEKVNDLPAFLQNFTDDLWIIGGAEIYTQTMDIVDELYITRIAEDLACDTFYPAFNDEFRLISQTDAREQNGYHYRYEVYARAR